MLNACLLFEGLRLPIRLRRLSTGVYVIHMDILLNERERSGFLWMFSICSGILLNSSASPFFFPFLFTPGHGWNNSSHHSTTFHNQGLYNTFYHRTTRIGFHHPSWGISFYRWISRWHLSWWIIGRSPFLPQSISYFSISRNPSMIHLLKIPFISTHSLSSIRLCVLRSNVDRWLPLSISLIYTWRETCGSTYIHKIHVWMNTYVG